jgi:hypothetical protein
VNFFEEYFPDSIPLLGKEKMIEDYFNTRPLPLISIKVVFLTRLAHNGLKYFLKEHSYFRLGLISAPDISERDISAWSFHQGDFSQQGNFGTRTFRHGYFSTSWTFRHEDVTALGHFGTRLFWHTDIYAQGHPCQNVCAEISITVRAPL